MTRSGILSIHKIRSLEFLTQLKCSNMAFHIAIQMAYTQLNFPLATAQKLLECPTRADTEELTHILTTVVVSLLKNIQTRDHRDSGRSPKLPRLHGKPTSA